MSVKQDSSHSETYCCCVIMSWVGKFKELVQADDSKKDSKSVHSQMNHKGLSKENEMKMFPAPTIRDSSSKELEDIDGGSGTPSNGDYLVVNKSVEQEDEKEVDGVNNGSTSPTDSTVSSKAATAAAQAPAKRIQWQSLADLPVPTKNALGLFHKNELLVGGGFTGRPSDDAVVHSYDSNFDIWNSLPPAPLKWSALASLDDKVVLVGGKEVGNHGVSYTNRLAVLDEEGKGWKFFHPSMQYARLSPVVNSYDGYLIVAGGKKGSLDYNVEIFDSTVRQWRTGAPLPYKCFRHTSTTIDRAWYLLSEDSGYVYVSDILALIQHTCGSSRLPVRDLPTEDCHPDELNSSNVSWRPIETQPPSKPFCITSVDGHLLALSRSKGAVSAFAYMDGSWEYVGKLPYTAGTASMLVDSFGQLYLFGGESGSGQYSCKLLKVTLVSKCTKKPALHVSLDTATFLTSN